MLKNTLTSLALTTALLIAGEVIADEAKDQHSSAPEVGSPEVRLYTLDCGTIIVRNINMFSDTEAYTNTQRTLKNGCFLVKHADHWLLWDTGLPDSLKGKEPPKDGPFGPIVTTTLEEQLSRLKLTPKDIDVVAVSHYHFDHIGNLAMFKDSKLIIHKADYLGLQTTDDKDRQAAIAPFKEGNVVQVQGDHDVFGDGLVQTLVLPGHTDGHMGLKVTLANAGTIILSGDQYHFEENRQNRGVPDFNEDRSDTLASHNRLEELLENLDAQLIIQHEPKDLAKLPPIPAYLK